MAYEYGLRQCRLSKCAVVADFSQYRFSQMSVSIARFYLSAVYFCIAISVCKALIVLFATIYKSVFSKHFIIGLVKIFFYLSDVPSDYFNERFSQAYFYRYYNAYYKCSQPIVHNDQG
jgi:hypothetical protein